MSHHKKQEAREITFNTTSNLDIWLAAANASAAAEHDILLSVETNQYLAEKAKEAIDNLKGKNG